MVVFQASSRRVMLSCSGSELLIKPEVSRCLLLRIMDVPGLQLRRMALRVVAVGLLSLMWSALTVVAQLSPASAPGPAYYDYAPAPPPASVPINYTYYNVPSDVKAMSSIMGSWNQSNPNLASLLPGWSVDDVQPCVNGVWMGIFCSFDFSGNDTRIIDGNNVTMVPTWVSGLAITNTDLLGNLPPEFGDLKRLVYIYITGTKLSGPIPNTLGKLVYLEVIDLHSNYFNGSIPPELGNIEYFYELDLSKNQLTGIIPSNLGNASNLYTLKLSQNYLNGTIPAKSSGDGPGLSNLQYLISLELMENSLTGPLPDLRNSTILTNVNVSHNELNGSVVLDSIFNLTSKITTLDLSSNGFTGPLPNLSRLSKTMVQLGLSDNCFNVSPIPSWLKDFQGLIILQMANSSLTGAVDTYLVDNSTLPRLQYLNMERNNLSGTLDLSSVPLTGSVALKWVNLTSNQIVNVKYNRDMLLKTSSQANVHYMLEGNPYCIAMESQNMTPTKYYFCRNATAQTPVFLLADQYRKVIIGTSVSLSTACLLIAAIALHFCWRNRRDKKRLRLQIEKEFAKSDVQPTLYSYSDLRAATGDFNPEMVVGEGAFGVVYKGVQPDGSEVAVKHLLSKSQQGIAEFLNEVVLITGVRHRNLVKLKGCCLRDDKRLLVYEFVENNNLAEVLFEGKGEHDLNWGVRYNICLGIAQGLHYLHENALPRIIHRDIKAPNILLDKGLNAKIADFGLARLFPDDESHISTLHIAGTTGYMAPEYASRGQLTEKADVFSFGVVVLEIVSGRRNIEPKLPVEDVYLIEHAWRCHEAGSLLDIVDNTLNIQGYEAEVERMINIALLCLQATGQKRPSMARVVSLLKGDVEMEVVVRESYSSRPQYESFMKTAQSDSGVSTINFKYVEAKPLLHDESSSKTSIPSSSRTPSFPPSHVNSTYVELTTITPR